MHASPLGTEPPCAMQAELQSIVTELKRTREEVQSLRSQLTAAVEESAQLKSELASLSEEAAIMESRLNAEVTVCLAILLSRT